MDKKVSSARSHRPISGKTSADAKSSSAKVRNVRPSSGSLPINPPKIKSGVSRKQKSSRKDSVTETTEDGIVFINSDSKDSGSHTSTRTISAEEILERCQETDYRQVYEINLRGNHLAEIPNLEKFAKVRLIDLSSNHIRTICRLECCSELRELKLYDNRLTAIEKLDSLNDLHNVQLQHNRIQSIGRGLVNCRKLTTLRLDSNQIVKIETREVAALSRLTTLDLSNNKLDNLSALNSLPNLTELSVCNNRLRTIELTRCKKLEEVDVSGNRFTDFSSFILHSSSLKILNLSKNAFSKLELSSPLSHLEELYISHNNIKGLTNVPSRFPSLQILDLSHNLIRNDQELLHLQDCVCLRELNLLNNPFELNDLGQVETNPAEIISSLQVLDGMVIKKQTVDHKTPLMRPMSASHIISSRQVQSQLDGLHNEMMNLQNSLEAKFRDFRLSLDRLPSRPNTALTARPPTRGSRRSRILEAQSFAINKYSNN
ncbi:protein phosphatase 1 regulatory subunit SDS22 homolog [Watersipora subatra]|uniref:protein phosphatase 1 regulatory subunit SDS22 homolog n=1 Tax=Watersipora subatra TaxID=2589382 RepID=UPI00355BD817